jgi:hypothetical protein
VPFVQQMPVHRLQAVEPEAVRPPQGDGFLRNFRHLGENRLAFIG